MQKWSYFSVRLHIYAFLYHFSLHCFPRCPHTPSARGARCYPGPARTGGGRGLILQLGLSQSVVTQTSGSWEAGAFLYICRKSHEGQIVAEFFLLFVSWYVVCVRECVYKENTSFQRYLK